MQLRHPAGKKAVSMDKGKYDVLKTPLLNHLKAEGESTHKEILRAITEDLAKKNTTFQGSIEWHMEWVKLDLEARNEIKRIEGKSPIRFALVK
jgi:hypothetical protein